MFANYVIDTVGYFVELKENKSCFNYYPCSVMRRTLNQAKKVGEAAAVNIANLLKCSAAAPQGQRGELVEAPQTGQAWSR